MTLANRLDDGFQFVIVVLYLLLERLARTAPPISYLLSPPDRPYTRFATARKVTRLVAVPIGLLCGL